jgi:TolA-binding protein
MNCSRCQDKLLDLLYGELSRRQRARVEAHLKDCPRCAREYERLKEVREAFAGISDPEPPAELDARIKAFAHEDAETAPGASGWRIVFHPAFATAVIAILAGGVLLFEMHQRPRPETAALPDLEKYRTAGKVEWDGEGAAEYAAAEEEKPRGAKGGLTVVEKPVSQLASTDELKAKREVPAAEDKPAGAGLGVPAEAEGGARDEYLDVGAASGEASAPPAAEPAPAVKHAEPELDKKDVPRKSVTRHVVLYTPERRLEIAENAMKRDDWKGAEKILTRSLTTMGPYDPLRPSMEYKLALCYIHLKEYDKARELLEVLANQGPSYLRLDALFSLAEVYTLEGEIEKAKAVYQRIKDSYPDRADEAQEKLEAIGAGP